MMNRHLVIAWLIAATLVVAATPATAATTARDRAAASTPHNTFVAAGLSLSLIEQDFAVEVDGTLRLRFEVLGELPEPAVADEPIAVGDDGEELPFEGPGPVEADRPEVQVFVTSYEPLTTRDQVSQVLLGFTGLAVDSARFELADVLESVADETHLVLEVPTATEGNLAAELELPIRGLYPITVEIRAGGARIARHITFAERLTAPGELERRTRPFNLAIVAGIEDPGPEPEPLQLVEARSQLLEVAQLGEDIGSALTVSIPPVVVLSIAEESELSGRLADALAGDEAIAQPLIQLDPSSMVVAGELEALTRELRRGEDVLSAALPASATSRSSALITRPLSAAGAAALRDLGVQLLILPMDRYHELEGSLPPAFTDPSMLYLTELPGQISMGVAVIDPVSARLDPRRADAGSIAETAVAVLAELSATRLQLSNATRLAVLSGPDFQTPDADVLVHLERMVDGHPAFSFQSLSFVSNATDVFRLDGAPRMVTFPEVAGLDITARSDRLARTRLEIAKTGSMLPAEDQRPDAWNQDLDTWLSTAFTNELVDDRIDQLIDTLEEIPNHIVPPEPFTFTLTGQTSEVTLRIGNTDDTPLTVLLRAESSKLRFPEEAMRITLQPGINMVELPVRTRANGTFPVSIELLTPVGQEMIGEPIVLTARVNALTGLGQVLTGGAFLVLASWWFSHLRSRRRHQHEVAQTQARHGHPSTRTDRVESP
jgi:HAMP domain-containing protein